MTELERLVYAKELVDKMADGINPLDDTVLPEDDLLNNIKISRCMFYVSQVLRQAIECGGTLDKKKNSKQPFSVTAEQLEKYEFAQTPISLTEIARKINALNDNPQMRKIGYRHISSWLVKTGMLCDKENMFGKMKKFPTEAGLEIGIFSEIRHGSRGTYEALLFNKDAQCFILDNIEAVIAEM